MASNNSKSKKKVRIALKEQSEEAEKSGRCRRILCDVLTLRILGYILKQPPSCTFIVTLGVIALCLPFIGLFIEGKERLPDLDAMQVTHLHTNITSVTLHTLPPLFATHQNL